MEVVVVEEEEEEERRRGGGEEEVVVVVVMMMVVVMVDYTCHSIHHGRSTCACSSGVIHVIAVVTLCRTNSTYSRLETSAPTSCLQLYFNPS